MAWWRRITPEGWALIGAGMIGVALVTREVVISVVRGPRVGPKTAVTGEGIVMGNPAELARVAGMTLDAYALARTISSEHGSASIAVKVAVAWAVRNASRRNGRSVFEQLTRQTGSPAPANGLFSAQGRGPSMPGFVGASKYASTRQDPYQQEAQIATAVMGGTLPDPTGGATNFFSPKAQRAAHDKDPTRVKPPETVIATWTAGGLRVVAVDGVDPDLITFFRPASAELVS